MYRFVLRRRQPGAYPLRTLLQSFSVGRSAGRPGYLLSSYTRAHRPVRISGLSGAVAQHSCAVHLRITRPSFCRITVSCSARPFPLAGSIFRFCRFFFPEPQPVTGDAGEPALVLSGHSSGADFPYYFRLSRKRICILSVSTDKAGIKLTVLKKQAIEL